MFYSNICSKALVEKLSISGKKTTINLSTIENENSSIQTDCVKLKVSSLDGSNTVWIDSALVTGYIPALKVLPVTMNFLAYKHLNHINPIPSDYTQPQGSFRGKADKIKNLFWQSTK